MPVETRFWAKVEKTDSCWLWRGGTAGNGYGKFKISDDRASVFAHRLAYEFLVGPIPEGRQLDHLCRTTLCVNPAHLEPVTNRENSLRAQAAKRRARRVGGQVLLEHEREPDIGVAT